MIFYSVNHCQPCSSNGYAVRSHGVAKGLLANGVKLIATSKPGGPWEKPGVVDDSFQLEHRIDGVRYIHTPLAPAAKESDHQFFKLATQAYIEAMRVFKPRVVMAASNWRNAKPARDAARHLGLPFLYEVRGFWEISIASRNPAWAQSADFQQYVAHEAEMAKSAEAVFTLNSLMAQELVRRGVDEARIHLVPNGFPGWPEASPVAVTKAALGLNTNHVVGYIGSFSAYEGLEWLIQAVALLRQQGVDVGLLLVGSGEATGFGQGGAASCAVTASYVQLAQSLGVADHVCMPGRVSSSMANGYYELLDVVVIPRRPLPVCELVSPMKPLEAASHGKRVLMSNVAPLAELAPLSKQFSYFEKGSVASLVQALKRLLAEPALQPDRTEALSQRTWANNVKPMVDVIQAFTTTKVVWSLPHKFDTSRA